MSTTTTPRIPTADADLAWLARSTSVKDGTLLERAHRMERLTTTRGMSTRDIEAHQKQHSNHPLSYKQIAHYLRVLRALTSGGRTTTAEDYGRAFTAMNTMTAAQKTAFETAVKTGVTVEDAAKGATTSNDATVTPGNSAPVTADKDIAAFGKILDHVATLPAAEQIRFGVAAEAALKALTVRLGA